MGINIIINFIDLNLEYNLIIIILLFFFAL
jgi:hypothetical protein